ncbi:MAG TPA: DUF2254 family protein [Thermomicrobiales bacterium]|nr:DUF2254 family protein [Thermomicrobiales bacterium]
MDAPDGHPREGGGPFAAAREVTRRGFAEFLAVPTGIIAGFVLLAVGTYLLDRADLGWLRPFRRLMLAHVFGSPQATASLLGTVASSVITVTSITFSLLLLAVQQSAATLTSQVYDQFLRRRLNQAYFGVFIGLALYALIILATVNPPFNPVYSATIVLLFTISALYLLLLLLYTTINQMRPAVVIEAIHDHTLAARRRQLDLLRRTRRAPGAGGPAVATVTAERRGFVTRIDPDAIATAVGQAGGTAEVALLVSIGAYVAYRDTIAEVRTATPGAAGRIADATRAAIQIERQRDLDSDPAYGIEQLTIIAWTSISTAKSNPAPGLLAIRMLRDLLAYWTAEEEAGPAPDGRPPAPVVYADNLLDELLDSFESLAVVASESMQHQSLAGILRTLAITFDRLAPAQQRRAEDLIRRSLSALGEHVLTAELDAAITRLVGALLAAGRFDTAALLEAARAELGASVGRLNSRSTRASVRGA